MLVRSSVLTPMWAEPEREHCVGWLNSDTVLLVADGIMSLTSWDSSLNIRVSLILHDDILGWVMSEALNEAG